MPIMLNVSEVLSLDVGDMVPGVKGIVKITFKRSEGIGRDKTGSVQTAFLKELDGEQEIKLKLWDREDVANLTGKQVWLVAKQGTTGLTGLKVEMDAYTNAKGEDIREKVLVVKKQTEIVRHDGAAGASVPDKRVPQDAVPSGDDNVPFDFPAKPAPTPAPAPAPAPKMPPTSASWKEIGNRIRSIGAFQAAAMCEVIGHVIPAVARQTDVTVDDYQTIQAMTATIMIRYDKMFGATNLPDPWAGYIEEKETK